MWLPLAVAPTNSGNPPPHLPYSVMFDLFCQASAYAYLASTTETEARYVVFMFERGTAAPGTIQSYPTPIMAVYTLIG